MNTTAQLKEEFLRLFTYRDELIHDLGPSYECLYLRLIGRLEFEIFYAEIEVKALTKKINMAKAYIKRGEKPDTQAIEAEIKAIWEKYQAQIMQKAGDLKWANSASYLTASDSDELKLLYRALMKKLHPDVNPALADQLQMMLIAAQAAYKAKDLRSLRQIAIKYELMADNPEEQELSEEQQARLVEQIANLKQEIEQLESSFPLNMREQLNDEQWVEDKRADLQVRKDELEQQKTELDNIYSLLINR